MVDVPPHAIESERVIVSAMVLLGESCTLAPDAFYDRGTRAAYVATKAILGRGLVADLPTLAQELEATHRLAEVGGTEGLVLMVDATPAVANLEQHVEMVRQAHVRRRAGLNGKALAGLASEHSVPIEVTLAEHAEVVEQLREQAAGPAVEREPVKLIEPVTGDALFAPLEPLRWLVAGLDMCPGAPTVVAGYGFSGKTMAWQAAGVAICAGLPVWGAFSCRQGRVVHLDYEQGLRLTRERYQRLAWGMDLGRADVAPNLEVASLPHLYLDDQRAENELCRLTEGAVLCLVDSFRAACPTIEENSSEARRPLDMLARVSERTGVVVVVVHHARKPQRDAPGGAKMAIRGSGAIFDAAASVLVHEAEESNGPVRVSHEKARASGRLADQFTLTAVDVPDGQDPRAGLLVRADAAPSQDDKAADKRKARLGRLAVQVRELFQSEPSQTSPDTIASKLGRSKPDVRSVVALMVESGEVEQTGATRDRRLRWVGRE
jgi:hypothetical protein